MKTPFVICAIVTSIVTQLCLCTPTLLKNDIEPNQEVERQPQTYIGNFMEADELVLVRPYFPVRPADYQEYSYKFQFAASYKAYAYHNGVYRGYSNDYKTHETITGYAGYGDVFAITAMSQNGHKGVIADISVGPYHTKTGKDSLFKVATAKQMITNGQSWKFRNIQTFCLFEYDPIILNKSTDNVWASQTFPLDGGAEYVWGNEEVNQTIWLRYVVGGESDCISKDTDLGTNTCYCKVSDDVGNGNCYSFKNPMNLNNFYKNLGCEKRDCGQKFECVEGNKETDTMCIKKLIHSKIRKAHTDIGKCMQVHLYPPEVAYIPYQELN